jgi:hypothetical protein
VSTPLPNPKESHHQDIEIWISSKDKATSRVLSEPSYTILDVDALSSKLTSETLTNTNITLSTSLLLKELTVDSTSLLAERPQYQLETSSQSTESLKVPPSATLSLLLVIKELTPDVQEPTPQLLDILTTEAEPESDYHQAPEKQFLAFAEPQLVSLLVEEEMKSQS